MPLQPGFHPGVLVGGVVVEDHGMRRRINVEANDLLEFVGKFGVVGDLKGAHPMRLEPVPLPHPPHRGRADPHVLAIAGAVQWVASCGGGWLVSAMTRSTVS